MSKEPKRNVYVGHRYVPKIMGEWDIQETYEGLSIVTYQGTSYTSKKRVPVGVDILDEEYWVVTGNYNAQIDYYRDEVQNVVNELGNKAGIDYVDNEITSLGDVIETELDEMNNIKANKDDLDGRGVNIINFGAKPIEIDNEYDSTEDIQHAINSSSIGGRLIVHIPMGTYKISDTINLKSNLVITGGGTLKLKDNSDSISILYGKNVKNVTVSDIHIDGNKDKNENGNYRGIHFEDSEDIKIYRCHIENINGLGHDDKGNGIGITRCSNVSVTDNTVKNCTHELIGFFNTDNGIIGHNICVGSEERGILSSGNLTRDSGGVVIIGNIIEDVVMGVRVSGDGKASITGNHFYNVTHVVNVVGSDDNYNKGKIIIISNNLAYEIRSTFLRYTSSGNHLGLIVQGNYGERSVNSDNVHAVVYITGDENQPKFLHILNNVFINHGTTGGINIRVEKKNVKINNNHIECQDRGISIEKESENVEVNGNTVISDGDYAMLLSCKDSSVENNYLNGSNKVIRLQDGSGFFLSNNNGTVSKRGTVNNNEVSYNGLKRETDNNEPVNDKIGDFTYVDSDQSLWVKLSTGNRLKIN